MIKRVTMLARRRDKSLAAFREHWLGTHADIVRKMPRLHRYLQNHIVGTIGPAAGDAAFTVDGIPELWFLTEADKVAAFESAAAKELPIDEKNFIEGITIFPIEETVLKAGDGATKVLVLHRGRDAAADRLLSWSQDLAAALPGVRACVSNRVLAADGRPGIWREENPPDLIVELRFAGAGDREAAFAAPGFAAFAARTEDGGGAFASYLVDERVII